MAVSIQKRAFKLGNGQGAGKQVALSVVATDLQQQTALGFGFHPLGGDFQAQFVGHDHNGFAKHPVVLLRFQVANERLVNLQVVDIKAPEVREGGVAHAKIVYGYLNAGITKLQQLVLDLPAGIEQQAFGDLDAEVFFLQAQCLQVGKPVTDVK